MPRKSYYNGVDQDTRHEPAGLFEYGVQRDTKPAIITWFRRKGFGLRL